MPTSIEFLVFSDQAASGDLSPQLKGIPVDVQQTVTTINDRIATDEQDECAPRNSSEARR